MVELIFEDGFCMNGEDIHFEAKEAKDRIPDNAFETYSAFANTDGGTIVFGLRETEDRRLEITGVTDVQNKIQSIWNKLNNPEYVSSNILRDSDLYVLEKDGRSLIIMTVPRADRMDRPVYLKGNTRNSYRRNGEGDYKCTPNEIGSMFADAGGSTVDLRPVRTSDVCDLDKGTLDAYRTNFRLHSPDHPWNDLDDMDFMECINAAVKDDGVVRPSLAGLLMFGKEHNIVRELPNYMLEFRIPDRGNMGWKDRIVSGDGTWSGNVFDFYGRTMSAIISMNPKPREIGNDMVRIANTDLDRCMREMLVNALVNADYNQPCGVTVIRDTSMVSVRNPGWFRIPVSKAMEGGSSDQRNKAVGKMLSLIGVSERAGSGIVNMLYYCRRLGLEPPDFIEESEPNTVTVVLDLRDRLPRSKVAEDCSDRVVAMMLDDPKVTYKGISTELGIGLSRVQRIIGGLQAEGTVVRIGGTRGHWQVNRR